VFTHMGCHSLIFESNGGNDALNTRKRETRRDETRRDERRVRRRSTGESKTAHELQKTESGRAKLARRQAEKERVANF